MQLLRASPNVPTLDSRIDQKNSKLFDIIIIVISFLAFTLHARNSICSRTNKGTYGREFKGYAGSVIQCFELCVHAYFFRYSPKRKGCFCYTQSENGTCHMEPRPGIDLYKVLHHEIQASFISVL